MADQLGAGQDWAARLKRALVQGGASAPEAVPVPVVEIAPKAPAAPALPTASDLLAALGLPTAHPDPVAPMQVEPMPSSLLALLEPARIAPPPGLLAALAEPAPPKPDAEPSRQPAAAPVPGPPDTPAEPPPGLLAALADPAIVPSPPPEVLREVAPDIAPAAPAPSPPAAKPPRRVPPATAGPATPPRAAARQEPAFDPAEFAAAHAALLGKPPGKAALEAGASAQDEWIALSRSMAGASSAWYGLALGGRTANMLVAAGLGAKRRNLTLRLQVVEADPEPFSRLHAAVMAQAFTAAEVRLLQAEVCATAAQLAPRAAAAEELLAEMPRCDYLRVSVRGVIEPLLNEAPELLAERVRWLVLATRTRGEEHQALTSLGRRGWQLLADHPCGIDRLSPPRLARAGTQVWRSPLA